MASMILGWTLNDVTTAMGLGNTDHLLHLRPKELREALRELVEAVSHRITVEQDVGVWLMCQQDSEINLHDQVVVGAPMVFGGKVPEVLWYLAPNEHVDGMPSTTTLASLQEVMLNINQTGPGTLPAPTVHLSGWHADADNMDWLLGSEQT
jgi:hypothetical protein